MFVLTLRRESVLFDIKVMVLKVRSMCKLKKTYKTCLAELNQD